MVDGKEDTKTNLEFSHSPKHFCAILAMYVNTRTSFLGAKRSLSNSVRKGVFPSSAGLEEILFMTFVSSPENNDVFCVLTTSLLKKR